MTRALALLLLSAGATSSTLAAAQPAANPAAKSLPRLPGPSPRAHTSHTGRAGHATLVQGLGRISGTSSCEHCHTEIAAEWTASLHRQSFSDPVFLKAYAVEPLAFCRGCHAPEANAAREPDAKAIAIGVACTTCHVEDHRVVGARPAAADASHPVFADARLATAAACAGCHQFNFPQEANQRFPEAMQDTAHEHARSAHSAAPCQRCHMPLIGGAEGKHRSHSFAVISDPAMIRRAAKVAATRADAQTALITIEAGDVGHSFPTGDMFRRLELRAEAIDKTGVVIVSANPVVLARTFRDVPRDPTGRDLSMQRIAGSDSRIAPPGTGGAARPARISLKVTGAQAGSRIHWQVVYQRMSAPMAEAFQVSQVLDEIVVAEGVLSPFSSDSSPTIASVKED